MRRVDEGSIPLWEEKSSSYNSETTHNGTRIRWLMKMMMKAKRDDNEQWNDPRKIGPKKCSLIPSSAFRSLLGKILRIITWEEEEEPSNKKYFAILLLLILFFYLWRHLERFAAIHVLYG